MQELPKIEGLRWLWLAIPLAIVGVLLTPGKRALREIAVMLFIGVVLGMAAAGAAIQFGAGGPVIYGACAVAALIGRNVLTFFMDVSQDVLRDEELRQEMAAYIRDRIKAWVKKRNGHGGKE